MSLATWIARALELYLALGVIFALLFVWRGVGRFDPVARTGTVGFRLMILPGCALLWPWLLARLGRGAAKAEVLR